MLNITIALVALEAGAILISIMMLRRANAKLRATHADLELSKAAHNAQKQTIDSLTARIRDLGGSSNELLIDETGLIIGSD